MIHLSGVALQTGPAVTAPVATWPVYGELSTQIVLAAPHLTIEVARRALQPDVCAVVTQDGGFACHGANVLRTRSPSITWLTGVDLSHIPPGELVSIDDSDRPRTMPAHINTLEWSPNFEWVRLQSLEKVAPSAICYWGHREYDALTSSLMIPGLTACAERLAGKPVTITTDPFGHLWFEGALSTQQYAALLMEPDVTSFELRLQTQVYRRLRASVFALTTPQRIQRAFFDYFSVHLLTHNTYEVPFIKLAQAEVERGARPEDVDRLVAQILRTPFVAWHRNDPTIQTHKSIYDTVRPSHAPDEPVAMIEHHVAELKSDWWDDPSVKELWPMIEFACSIAILKEYKFFLNKLIYSAASEWLREHGPAQLVGLDPWTSL